MTKQKMEKQNTSIPRALPPPSHVPSPLSLRLNVSPLSSTPLPRLRFVRPSRSQMRRMLELIPPPLGVIHVWAVTVRDGLRRGRLVRHVLDRLVDARRRHVAARRAVAVGLLNADVAERLAVFVDE